MDIRAAGAKTSETTARLLLVGGGAQAWLEPISSKPDCDLVLSGQGDGKVLVDDSPVLTVEALANVDELADILANLTVVGLDNAAVQAMIDPVASDLQAVMDALAQVRASADAATAVAAIGNLYESIARISNDVTVLETKLEEFDTAIAGHVAQILAGLGPTLGSGVDEAAVNALIEAQLVNIGPMLQQAIESHMGHITGKLDLDVTADGDGAFVIATNNLSGAQHKVGIDFVTQRDGDITVNGKRVLTTDDAVGGGTVDTEAVIQAVVDYLEAEGSLGGLDNEAVTQLITEAIEALELGTDEETVNALIEAQLVGVGPMLMTAIQSAMKALPPKITLNVDSALEADKVVIEAWQLKPPPNPPTDNRTVDVDIEPFGDGVLRVKGKRVLTTDDALEAGGAGIDQAALEAAVAAATAPLLTRIDALEAELAKRPTTEYMQEQFGNFNDLLSADITQTAQLALAEQKKLQALIDVIGGVINCDLDTVKRIWAEMNRWMGVADIDIRNLKGDVEALADMFNQIQNLINEVVEYVITEYATKVESKQGDDAVLAEVTKINDGLAAFEQQVGEAVPAMINEGFDERVPQILAALQTHLENVLAIFGGGGTTGVTPAQIAELTAEFARLYATKDSLAAYAKLDDGNQEINAGLVKARGVQFTINDEVLVPLDFEDYGTRLSLIPKNAMSTDDAGIVVLHTDLADLIPGAKEV